MLERLERLRELRGGAPVPRVDELKSWQQARLKRTYADLAANPRYAPATVFFFDELYGAKDGALRDRDLLRMYPTMKRLLPRFAFDTVDRALELDVLAEEFDQAVARALGKAPLDETSYTEAFRAVDRHADRARQVALMREVGQGLDKVVAKPLIYSTLKMLRKPAAVAGLADMQAFLEAGFTAFRHMKGADYFLDTIASRETLLMERIFDADPAPFAIIDTWQPATG